MREHDAPQLACNYSPQLVALLRDGRAEVEWIKLSRWDVFAAELAVVRPLRPVLLHVLPRAGLRSLDSLPWTWEEMNSATAACGSPHAALHLASSRTADWERLVALVRPRMRRCWSGSSRARRCLRKSLMRHCWWRTCPSMRRATRCCAHPAIRRSSPRCAIGRARDSLLDLAHAQIAAHNRREDVRAYLSGLPLERVREVHVCGPAPRDTPRSRAIPRCCKTITRDGRGGFALLVWTLERTHPSGWPRARPAPGCCKTDHREIAARNDQLRACWRGADSWLGGSRSHPTASPPAAAHRPDAAGAYIMTRQLTRQQGRDSLNRGACHQPVQPRLGTGPE